MDVDFTTIIDLSIYFIDAHSHNVCQCKSDFCQFFLFLTLPSLLTYVHV